MDRELLDDPIAQFTLWLEDASKTEKNDPGAMSLATCTKDGKPSVRIVLLKQVDEQGFKFHTNSSSQKGRELLENPNAALCFHWKSLRKQVRVEGVIKPVSEAESNTYFTTRPYNRQIGAWASQQSHTLESRAHLESKIVELEKKYPEGTNVPRPKSWRGYRLVPQRMELWMDNPDRLHDRFTYTKNKEGNWDIERLYP